MNVDFVDVQALREGDRVLVVEHSSASNGNGGIVAVRTRRIINIQRQEDCSFKCFFGNKEKLTYHLDEEVLVAMPSRGR